MSGEKPILHYFKVRGLAETARMMFTAGGIEWEEAPYLTTAEQVAEYRTTGQLLFNQFPLWKWHGKNLVQSMATVRYIARKCNLTGNNLDEETQIDMLCGGINDYKMAVIAYKFMPDDVFYQGANPAADKYLPIFEKIVKESGGDFLVGKSLSMADVCLLEVLVLTHERLPDKLNAQPNLKAFYDRLRAMPNFAKYFAGPKFWPPNSADRVDVIKKALGM